MTRCVQRIPARGLRRLAAALLPAPTALVVPVPEAQQAVSCVARSGEQPVAHVTVLWPFLRRLRRRDRATLTELAAGQPAFDFQLRAIATFPDVVYLAPQPSERFRALTEAIVARWPHRPPYAGAFAEVIPHLTLRVGDGLRTAEEQAVRDLLPIAAAAREILVVRPGPRRWRVLYRVALDATASE